MQLMRKVFPWLYGDQWHSLADESVPEWVVKAADRFEAHYPTHPYNVVKHFVGRTYVYRVWFEWAGTGQTKRHFYRKRK